MKKRYTLIPIIALLSAPIFANEAPDKTHKEKMQEIELSVIETSKSIVKLNKEIRYLRAELTEKEKALVEEKAKKEKQVQELRKLHKEKES